MSEKYFSAAVDNGRREALVVLIYAGSGMVDVGADDFDLTSDEIIIETGIDSAYLDGEYGWFLPSSTLLTFAFNGQSMALAWFRDSVTSVEIRLDGVTIFNGNLDRKTVAYDYSTKILTAEFLPFIRPDRDFKSDDGAVDEAVWEAVFGVSVGGDTGTAADDWIRVRTAVERLLTYFGAKTVAIGNFNRLMSAVILASVGTAYSSTATAGGAGYDGSTDIETWLQSADENVIFDKLLIYKKILAQDQKYSGPGATTLLDIMDNLGRELAAVMGVAPDGTGYVVPMYSTVDASVPLLDEQIITASSTGYVDKTAAMVVAGKLYPFDGQNPQPGVSFVPTTVFGDITYNDAGVHYSNFWSVATLGASSDELEYSLIKMMHNPLRGSIMAGVGVGAFGYCPDMADDDDTHTGTLYAVKYLSSELPYDYTGSAWTTTWDVSSPICMAAWYYSMYRIDREEVSLTLAGIDYPVWKHYELPPSMGSLPIRPTLISTNLTRGETTMKGVSVLRADIIRPGHATGEFDGVVQVSAVNYSAKTGEWTTFADRMVGHAFLFELFSVSLTVRFTIPSSGTFRVWLKSMEDTTYCESYLSYNGGSNNRIYLSKNSVLWIDCGSAAFVAGDNTIAFKGYAPPDSEVHFTLYDFYITKNGDVPNY